ncbi:H/ACA ribonucleoprotein complex subunit 3-like [Centruroides sculpturatus]|uniref:H/ACA ribonucleoprotein complex subunit 3-like n=1 Tax=Centruroides sculpturatus TaxID=218467 RepID=UPI000C6EBCAC|nr:H/ACA ribonucleoprotein complex subunit 3-like [Centruroides sculpturatus]
MYLKYYLNENGDRIYTLKDTDQEGKPTVSAHPARFSPEDKYSKHRLIIKRRFHLLPIQKEKQTY